MMINRLIQLAVLRKWLAGSVATLLMISSASATVLTFDIDGINPSDPVPQAYGDNVNGATMGNFHYGSAHGFTPNITASYGMNPEFWPTDYSDLSNVIFEATKNTGVLEITLTADPGFLVQLHGFDLGAYAPGSTSDPTIDSITIFNGENVPLFMENNVTLSLTTHTSFVFSMPLAGTSIRIEVDARNLGTHNDNIGIDNISFGQVPEPSTTSLLLVAGAAGAGLILRKRRPA